MYGLWGEEEAYPVYFCLQNILSLEEARHGVEEGVQVWGLNHSTLLSISLSPYTGVIVRRPDSEFCVLPVIPYSLPPIRTPGLWPTS